ncbi:MAG: hypothetical protein HY819_09835 [Acidobacteria bacterium]|nr:hypothetical protein [Acidobacteriota bacterium]
MFFDILHKHYWGPPRRSTNDGAYYMTCYECGKKRKLKVNIDDEPEKRMVTAVPEKNPRAA